MRGSPLVEAPIISPYRLTNHTVSYFLVRDHLVYVFILSINGDAPYVKMIFCFKVYGYTSIFSHHVSKGDDFCDFLFAYQEDEVFPKWGLLLIKE